MGYVYTSVVFIGAKNIAQESVLSGTRSSGRSSWGDWREVSGGPGKACRMETVTYQKGFDVTLVVGE